tara:strand:+ start:18657 stop:19556 length:900 start_codon:yes stop_codon:yes gene_type:complete
MRNLIKYLSSKSNFTLKIIRLGINLRNRVIPLEIRLKQRFKRKLGYTLNLKHPKTFNEKIQWLKLYDKTDLHTICADKYAVRSHIQNKIGAEYLVPLILQTTDVNDLKPSNLPNYPVIIKTNHDSSGGIFVWDKQKINWPQLRKDFNRRLSQNYDYGKGEWQYKDIPPCIIIEKLLIDEHGNIPSDYKLHCFNGKLAFTQVDMDRSTQHKRNLYDVDWNFMNCTWAYQNGNSVPKPKVYDEMKRVAEILAGDFKYVRADFYIINDKIFFGELTFHSDSGNGLFSPPSWDNKIGEMLNLN